MVGWWVDGWWVGGWVGGLMGLDLSGDALQCEFPGTPYLEAIEAGAGGG